MAKLLLDNLKSNKHINITIINRSIQNAIKLKNNYLNLNINVQPIENLYDNIANSNLIFVSTSSNEYLINPEPLTKIQNDKIIHIIDISLPRNVNPLCNSISNIKLYNIDDLKNIQQSNINKRKNHIDHANSIINNEIIEFNTCKNNYDTRE